MKSYIFKVDLDQDEDGRWNAVVPSLRACYTWGETKEQALANIQDAVKGCVHDMIAHGEAIPDEIDTIDAAVASVTVESAA